MATSWEHLLGGYATNTLTDEEKRQLFEAALHDQSLFDALADEEALKAMLADPETHQRILASLQATEHSEAAKKGGKWRDWFRQQSSLAWAGSIAAVGLALIFGWQMEKEWGPVVSQEQEAAKSSSRDELAFRREKPSEAPTAAVPNEILEKNVNQTEGKNGESPSTSELSPRVETNKVDRLGEVPGMAKQESEARGMGQAKRRQRSNEQVAQAPPSSSPSNRSKFEPSVQPLPIPQSPEVTLPEIAPEAKAPGRFADRLKEDLSQTPPGAQELFYASSGFLADEVITEKKDKERTDQGSKQSLRGVVSKELKPASKKKPLSFPLEREVAGGSAIPTSRGIRYSFVQHTKEGKDEEVEIRKIAGNWSEIRLAIESNVSGYLYVLAPLDNGKWQNLVPMDPELTKKTEGGIKVKSFQRVECSLDQLTDTSGQLVVPSLTVLLSPVLLENLGQWLGSEVDRSEFQIERAEGAVFVVQPTLVKGNPLYVVIPLMEN